MPDTKLFKKYPTSSEASVEMYDEGARILDSVKEFYTAIGKHREVMLFIVDNNTGTLVDMTTGNREDFIQAIGLWYKRQQV